MPDDAVLDRARGRLRHRPDPSGGAVMTALLIAGGLLAGYVLGRCGWFVLVIAFDGDS